MSARIESDVPLSCGAGCVGVWQRACGHYAQAQAVTQRAGDTTPDPDLLLNWAEALLGTMGALADTAQGHEGSTGGKQAGLQGSLPGVLEEKAQQTHGGLLCGRPCRPHGAAGMRGDGQA